MDRHLEKLQKEIAMAVEGITPDQLRWHVPGKWSVAEVLEHLYLTYTGTIKGFERVAAGQHFPSKPERIHPARRFVVLVLGHMPAGREAPANTRPRGLDPEKIRVEINTRISEMDETITRCAEACGSGRLLDHPILGPLTAAQWRKFHLVHGRHHVQQIRRLRESFSGK
jgi:DinB superfamily